MAVLRRQLQIVVIVTIISSIIIIIIIIQIVFIMCIFFIGIRWNLTLLAYVKPFARQVDTIFSQTIRSEFKKRKWTQAKISAFSAGKQWVSEREVLWMMKDGAKQK